MGSRARPPEPRRRLATLLSRRKEELIRRWTRRVLEDPRIASTERLSEPELRDQTPELLDSIARELAGHGGEAAGRAAGTAGPAKEHAQQRVDDGFGLTESLRELSHLRAAILDACADARVAVEAGAGRLVHAAIDQAMITAAEERERGAHERAQQLSELLDESHEAVIVWTLGGAITSWNRGAQELYGWQASEAVGRCPHELLHTLATGADNDEVKRVLVANGRWEGELEQTARDGRKLFVESRLVVRSCCGRTLVLEMNRDVTERRHAAEAQRESAALLRAIVETALDAILTIDERGTIETLNPAAERLFGYRARELIGGNIRVLMPEPYRAEHDAYLARYRRSGERHIIGVGRELVGRHKNGSTFPIDISISETWLGNRRIFTGILHDITERKKADEERLHILRSERTARAEAERAAHLRDEFVATVSHELRTPLNAILGWTAMLRSGRLDAAAAEKALEVVERNARAQAELVEDLLDISRIGSGKLRLHVRQVDLAAILVDVVASHQPAAEARGVTVEKALDDAGCTVMGDPGRLEQIASNLLSNAIKFTPRGGHILVSCRRVGSLTELVVRDTGQGIPAEFLPHVFDRFRQAASSLTRQHRGLGLGLALVKFLVEQHGGDIRAESDGDGRGATFTVELPVSAVQCPDARPTPVDACCSLGGIRVLVVDDEPDASSLVARILEDCDAEVSIASAAPEALDQLARVRPDVLISDIGMPEMDGYQLIRAVRALPQERGGATPAVALTAFAQPEDRLRALSAGYQMHVAKPVDQGELLVVVANLTGRLAKLSA